MIMKGSRKQNVYYDYNPQNLRLISRYTGMGGMVIVRPGGGTSGGLLLPGGLSPYLSTDYTYDAKGNITQMNTSYSWGYSQIFDQTFTYDTSDQLISGSASNWYNVNVSYGNYGRINTYNATLRNTQTNTTFSYPAVDIPSTAFAPESANNGTRTYQYGINGSLRSKQDTARTEYYLFNGFGNLKVYSDDGASYGYYSYDAGGERTYKMQLTEIMAQTNTYGGKFLEVEKLMLYPNGYINIDQYGNYTKHYYAESQRIASKIGGGSSRSMTDTVPRLQDYLTSQTGNGEVPIGIGVIGGGESVSTIPYYLTQPLHLRKDLENVVLPHDTIAQIIFDTVRITHLTGSDSTGLENELFFYHGDHLSSTQLVTDINGSAQQHVLYSAFGEVVYEYNAYWKQDTIPRFLYNSKEMDEESGMYYYSARYYAPPTFISRDPLFEKYPFISPYAYCNNNPIKLVDPDGKDPRPSGGPWKNIPSVIKESDFVGWQTGANCYNLAQKQMHKVNTVAGGITHQVYTENNGANKQQIPNAINYIQKTLEEGLPVLIGVDNRQGHPGNKDNTTDHFVVIVGMGSDKNGNYFQFYDNATNNKESGTSLNNKLYYNEEKGLIQGHSQTSYGRSWSDPNLGVQTPYTEGYIVTQIRRTRKEEIE